MNKRKAKLAVKRHLDHLTGFNDGSPLTFEETKALNRLLREEADVPQRAKPPSIEPRSTTPREQQVLYDLDLIRSKLRHFDGPMALGFLHDAVDRLERAFADLHTVERTSAGAIKALNSSVLLPWVMILPLRHQGTLLTGMRCCDVSPKNPVLIGEDSPERALHAYLRHLCLRPADDREVDVPGAWFRTAPPIDWKPSQFGHYPLHWFSHLMHCFEVCGYCHPDADGHRKTALGIYERLAHSLHLRSESSFLMQERLTEDRIQSGQIVS